LINGFGDYAINEGDANEVRARLEADD